MHTRNRFLLVSAAAGLLSAAGCSPAQTDAGTPSGGSSGANSGGSPGTGGKSSGSSSGGTTGGASSGGSTGSGGSPGSGGGAAGGSSGGTSGGGATGGSSGDGGSSGTGGSSSSGGTGGTGPDGGGGTDTPPATGAPGCMGVTAKFCSDFEGQTAGGAPNGNGDFSVPGGGVTVDGAKGYSGTKSLHFKPSGATNLTFTKQFPLTQEYGRLMLFVTKTPPNATHWDIVQSKVQASNNWEWGGMYGKFQLTVDKPDDGKDSTTVIPSGSWFCMQWEYKGSGNKTEYHVKMNGAEVDKSPVNNHWQGGPWTNLLVGFETYGGGVPIEFWVDDLAFGDAPIDCPAAK